MRVFLSLLAWLFVVGQSIADEAPPTPSSAPAFVELRDQYDSGADPAVVLSDLAEFTHFVTRVKVVPAKKARAIRDDRWLRSLGVARPQFVGDAGRPVEVEGTTGVWRLDPDASAAGFEGRTALLSPFDRLVHDRARAVDLFDFEYTLEMYKPKEKRRWGYFALPVLHHDRLIGKIDVAADRNASRLQVHAVHEDVHFTRAITAPVNAELKALATWLGLDEVSVSG